MHNKLLILFDIDNTLFNTAKYREGLWEELGKTLAPTTKDFPLIAEETYLLLRRTGKYFDTNLFSHALEERLQLPIDESTVDAKAKEMAESGFYLYPEVPHVLEALKEKAYSVGIFSTGGLDLQTAKVASIQHLLNAEHVHIFENKNPQLATILQKYNDFSIIFIDDFWKVLLEAKAINPFVTTIWMKRGRHAQNLEKPESFVPDFIITALDELLPLIDRTSIV